MDLSKAYSCKSLFLLLVFSGITFGANAQELPVIDSTFTVRPPEGYVFPWPEEEEKVSASEVIAEASALKFDTTEAIGLEQIIHDLDFIPAVPDEVIKDRLSCLQNEVPLNFQPRVRVFIDFFSVRKRDFTLRIMQRKNMYFPMFERYLAKHGVPDELKYLSIIESALIPNARSRASAVGLWQFMTYTGRMYGVKQYRGIDERRDPEKSTEAAAKYLKDLYKMFGDWELAIAAYNCGPGNVRKAQRRAGARHFWDIYHRLPRETRSYLPQFVAMMYVLNYAEEHNLVQDKPFYAIPSAEVYIDESVDLEKLAAELQVCKEDMELLNPKFTYSYVPANGKEAGIKIPASRLEFFVGHREKILAAAKYQSGQAVYASRSASSGGIAKGSGEKYYYTVRRGDALGVIAQRNGVPLSRLRQWNNLYGNKIYPGQKLVIYGKDAPPAAAASTPASKPAAPAPVKPAAGQKTYYTVKRGDVLGSIATSYNVGLSDLRSWNNIKGNTIYAGQKLVIYGKGAAQTSAASKSSSSAQTGSSKYHIVKEGETLWGISRKYEGVTVEKIKSLNNLKSDRLQAGQKLKIS